LAGTVFYIEPSLKSPILKINGYDDEPVCETGENDGYRYHRR